MRLIGNILWVIFGPGIVIFLEYLAGGLVLMITIIGIPFGIQCWKIGMLALWPFGREVTTRVHGMGTLAVIMNILWAVVAGIWIALTHIVLAIGWAVTIIGIPFAIQHVKLARLAFTPFGLEVRGTY